MRVSVGLKEEDLEFVDDYAAEKSASRSGVIQEAIRLLRDAELQKQYEVAFADWDASEDAALWDSTSADGIDEAHLNL
jgi:Arc/MetJ-type ribon-helix-helix transcriptional regulator